MRTARGWHATPVRTVEPAQPARVPLVSTLEPPRPAPIVRESLTLRVESPAPTSPRVERRYEPDPGGGLLTDPGLDLEWLAARNLGLDVLVVEVDELERDGLGDSGEMKTARRRLLEEWGLYRRTFRAIGGGGCGNVLADEQIARWEAIFDEFSHRWGEK